VAELLLRTVLHIEVICPGNMRRVVLLSEMGQERNSPTCKVVLLFGDWLLGLGITWTVSYASREQCESL